MGAKEEAKAIKQLTKKLGREPTEKEVAKRVTKLVAAAAEKGGVFWNKNVPATCPK
jgi:DNA-directed RNA polymerase specialized sigma subunit